MKLGHLNIDAGHAHLKLAAEGTFTLLALFSLMVAGAYFKQQEEGAGALVAQVSAAQPVISTISIPLVAKSALAYDAKTGKILFSKNPDQAMPLASLTKLMTAEAVLSLKALDTDVTITPDDLKPDGDSGLVVGDTWSLKNLLTFGLIESSNDALAAVARAAGGASIIDKMNEIAASLGLTNTRFNNPTGLDVDVAADEAGAYGSAHDMALLTADFLKRYPDFFEPTVSSHTELSVGGKEVDAVPTAEPLLDIPGLIGAKTGYTDLAGGNLVVAFDLEVGHPVIVVVLGSSFEGRFSDMRALINAVRGEQVN